MQEQMKYKLRRNWLLEFFHVVSVACCRKVISWLVQRRLKASKILLPVDWKLPTFRRNVVRFQGPSYTAWQIGTAYYVIDDLRIIFFMYCRDSCFYVNCRTTWNCQYQVNGTQSYSTRLNLSFVTSAAHQKSQYINRHDSILKASFLIMRLQH
jgi:hypothetical protein